MAKAVVVGSALLFLLTAVTVAVSGSRDRRGNPVTSEVTESRVIAEESTGNNWLVGGRTFDQQHFSPLKQITDRNVSGLGLAWSLDIDSAMGMSSEPIVVDGVIYVSAPMSVVYAVDAVSGKVIWTFDPRVRLDRMRNSWSARTNRGVAVWGRRVFVGTGDCRLVAIDAATGKQAWESTVCDATQTGITGAPHAGQGKVFIGYNGSDIGARGSVPAFDAETGKELWRFWTVPGDPAKGFESKALEMAAKTWTGDQWWKVGGGDDWDPITYDPVTGLVYIATAGSHPGQLFGDMAGYPVGGDRLFSGSIIAMKADTGEYVWHYQTGTQNNHTENNHILIADLLLDGQTRRVAMTAPKNGFFYVLDARTGQLLSGRRIANVTWATSIDMTTGRPVEVPPGEQRGRNFTAHNWFSMSFSAVTGLVYIPLTDTRNRKPAPGQTLLGGRLLAWDPVSQSARWSVEQPIAVNGGVLSTAGNLVFEGEGTGEFAAYSADAGRKLWSLKTGSAIDSTPVSFSAGGEQYIVVAVGWGSASRLFNRGSNMATPASKRGPARLLAFRLGAKSPFPTPHVTIPRVPRPPTQTAAKATIAAGQALYGKHFCSDCHAPEADGSGAWTEEGAIPDLRYMPPAVHAEWDAVVLWGSHASSGMPGFANPPGFPIVSRKMTPAESQAIHAYVIDQSWKAYDDDQRRLDARPRRPRPNTRQ